MIKSLSQLSSEADGRYATDEELSFLFDYLESINTRISAYEKIRDDREEILEKVSEKSYEMYPKLFRGNSDGIRAMHRRDVSFILRCLMTSVLFDDLDRTSNTVLHWHKTIVKSIRFDQLSKVSYQVASMVLREFLNGEEIERTFPALHLAGSILQ